MENKTEYEIKEEPTKKETKKFGDKYIIPIAIVIAGIMVAGAIVYDVGNRSQQTQTTRNRTSQIEEAVLPSNGVVLPVIWGNLGSKLVDVGAIDADKFKTIYESRGVFNDEYKNLLLGQNNNKLKITNENSGYLLNLFWALGLASKNSILEDVSEMMNPAYGGAGNFASTGGWTIAKGNPMNHYNKHAFFDLTPEQQTLVDKVSRGIYRPCCGNSVHFPDCNHGMAMLGLLELMASQDASEQDMWETALAVNSYWFPDTYLTIATYMESKGIDWEDINPQEVLGANYSSAQGYAMIASQVVTPTNSQNNGGCGVDTGAPVAAPAPKQQSGCGI